MKNMWVASKDYPLNTENIILSLNFQGLSGHLHCSQNTTATGVPASKDTPSFLSFFVTLATSWLPFCCPLRTLLLFFYLYSPSCWMSCPFPVHHIPLFPALAAGRVDILLPYTHPNVHTYTKTMVCETQTHTHIQKHTCPHTQKQEIKTAFLKCQT